MSISLIVDLGPLTHGKGINELLDVRDEALNRDQDSNQKKMMMRVNQKQILKIKDDFKEYISKDDSRE
jgi:hypothetical protein